MPTVRVKLDINDVRDALKKLGYGFHMDRRYPIWLTSADTKSPRRQSGTHLRVQHIPIKASVLERILEYADSVQEACNQIVALSHGKITDPTLSGEGGGPAQGGGIDPETIKAIVQAQVANEIAAADRQRDQENASLRRENESLQAKVEALLAKSSKPQKGKKPAPRLPPKPEPPAPEVAPAT